MVIIGVRSPRNRDPKVKTTWNGGPLAALDVLKQTGTIRVKAPSFLKVVASLKPNAQRVDGNDDPAAEAIYRYTGLPPGPNNQPGAPLTLDCQRRERERYRPVFTTISIW